MPYDHNGNYVATPRVQREVQFIGELPHDGAWIMHAVPTSGAKWAIVLADTLGKHAPRVVKDGVMSVLKPEYKVESNTPIVAIHGSAARYDCKPDCVPVGEVGNVGSGT